MLADVEVPLDGDARDAEGTLGRRWRQALYPRGGGVTSLGAILTSLGFEPERIEPLPGDASHRRYSRITLAGGSVMACVYPEGAEAQAERDASVQRWGLERGLPIPPQLAASGRWVVSADLGDEDLERAIARRGDGVVAAALDTLGAFQRCAWGNLATPAFDAAFFRRELAVFEQLAPVAESEREEVRAYLDDLASTVARHPYRLAHRDYHVNNLLLHGGRVWAIDYQDMRGGPDTYDAASLLRERGGARLLGETCWLSEMAAAFQWPAGYERRYLECAAQRGIKVIGTFLRLAREGRSGYLEWLPAVARRTREALDALPAPRGVREAVAGACVLQR